MMLMMNDEVVVEKRNLPKKNTLLLHGRLNFA